MPHIFVIVLLTTVVWTYGGGAQYGTIKEPSIAVCELKKKEFIAEIEKLNIGLMLRDEYDAKCQVYVSTIDQPI